MEFLKSNKEDIDQINRLVQLELEKWQLDAGKIDSSLAPLLKLFINVSQKGKTLRGLLVKQGYILAGGKVTEDILRVAASYEIFHTAILIHDDIIDNSEIRRGVATIHKSLSKNGKEFAICLGDAGFFLSTKLLTQTNFKESLIKEAINYFSQIQMETVFGQMLDIQKSDPVIVAKLKTARYSVSGPLVLGAKLAGCNKEFSERLEKFGENLGIAYQIQDDIFGLFASVAETGKSDTADIEEGKNTWLYSQAYKKSNATQKEILNASYGQGKIFLTGVEKIRQIVKSTGTLDAARKEALKYVGLAKKLIPEITSTKKDQDILRKFCDFVLERTK